MTLAIAFATCLECLRRPFVYIVVISLVMMSAASQLLHLFTFGAGAQEAINLAISAVLLAGLLNAAFVGTALIRMDVERGTLALTLAQPAGLGSYIAGRFLGLAAATLLACAATAGGLGIVLLVAGAPEGTFTSTLLFGWVRVGLAATVLAAASLAISAFASRLFAPVLFLALFVAGDLARSSALGRLLPALGLFGLDAGRAPPILQLSLYAALHSAVFLMATYLQLALRPPIKGES